MIHELKGRCLFSPVRLINSLVRWVLGVHSPSGTIKVQNTANPSEGKSIGLDVDVNALEALLDKNAQTKSLNKVQRQAVRDVVRSLVDGVSLQWGDNCLSVNMSWIVSLINNKETGTGEDDPSTAPDTELPAPTDGDDGFIGDDGTGPSAGDDVRWPTLNGVITDLRDGTTWSAGGGTGVVVPVVDEIIRVGLNDFYLMRKLTYDSAGHLRHVSGEFCAFKNLAYISSNS